MTNINTCTIIWNTLDLKQWNVRFAQVPRSNLLQSYEYAQSICKLNRQKARWGLIKIGGIEAGLVQILEASTFFGLMHAVILDRGPLWFENFGSEEHFETFCYEFNRQFPKRFGRKIRFIPEIEDSAKIQTILKKNNFKPINTEEYQTIWIDLTKSEEMLLKNLNPKWRNKLRKAQKNNLIIKWDNKGAHLPWLLNTYHIDKKEKKYTGPTPALLTTLAKYFLPKKNMIIGRALINDKPIAAILILCHGSSATYQIGWSSQKGRDTAAHHQLLWDAFCVLKNKDINDFDLGGVNDDSAKNVKKFKENMGGQLIRSPGIYH